MYTEFEKKGLALISEAFSIDRNELAREWLGFSQALLATQDIVHLWPNRNFRCGVQIVFAIADDVRTFPETPRLAREIFDTLMPGEEDREEGMKTLQEALRIMMTKTRLAAHDVDDANMLLKCLSLLERISCGLKALHVADAAASNHLDIAA